jgi:pimeloyl-ACP methyl ester carboxylesterase
LPLSQALANAIPGARLQIMAGCGHVMFYERPKDFNSRIIDFLAAETG